MILYYVLSFPKFKIHILSNLVISLFVSLKIFRTFAYWNLSEKQNLQPWSHLKFLMCCKHFLYSFHTSSFFFF